VFLSLSPRQRYTAIYQSASQIVSDIAQLATAATKGNICMLAKLGLYLVLNFFET